MANYFLDNQDIQFLFNHLDLAELARIQEDDFAEGRSGQFDYAPTDAADAMDSWRRVLTIVGEVAAELLAPNAETVDLEGNTLNDDGTVTLHPLVQENMRRLNQAEVMGFTLPRRFGGLNCPNLIYTMATEMVSRADGSLMNLFGLQGIAETINAFASEEIRQEVLPRFARGEVTGAMVLTEPDAGSDLQAVRLRAYQDDQGNWYLNGVKRFITNGCGEILLVLSRTEPEITDGRGLSLLIAERGPQVRVRHLEKKLGIHGSPTCELVFEDTPARLIGERQRGLITYVMALMNGARVGIAAQSMGIAEAAYRLARTYAHTRQQFGKSIERMPAVAELVTDMKIELEAGRALLYETSYICDLENNNLRVLETNKNLSKEEARDRKQAARAHGRINSMLTPMSKYYCSEMCVRTAHNTIQVLGGSGYMRDYPAERYLRDSRITTIYEGTSQLQVVARGARRDLEHAGNVSGEVPRPRVHRPAAGVAQAEAGRGLAVASPGGGVCEGAGTDLRRPFRAAAGRLGDRADRRSPDARAGSRRRAEEMRCQAIHRPRNDDFAGRANCEHVLSGDASPLAEYDLLAGPVPSNA